MLLFESVTLKCVLKWLALDLAQLHLCTCSYLSSQLAPCRVSVFDDESNNLPKYKGCKTSISHSQSGSNFSGNLWRWLSATGKTILDFYKDLVYLNLS